MFGSRLYATIVRGTRAARVPAIRSSTQLTSTTTARLQPFAFQTATVARRAFAIPAKPKKGSSAESGPKRSRAGRGTSEASTAVKKTKKRASPEQIAARKQAEREKREKQKAREQAKKLKAQQAKQKKVLTPEQQARKKVRDEKAEIKLLKAAALSPPVKSALSAWVIFNSEFVRSRLHSVSSSIGDREPRDARASLTEAVREAGREYSNLSPAERNSYEQRAKEQTLARQREYKSWVAAHTTRQILQANLARRKLRARETTAKNTVTKYPAIEDERMPRRPMTPFLQFFQERLGSGDFMGTAQTEALKLVAQEWKGMSEASKQGYNDSYREQREDYVRAYADATGNAPGSQTGTAAGGEARDEL